MGQGSRPRRTASEKAVKDIHRATHKHYSAEDKIRAALGGDRPLVVKSRTCQLLSTDRRPTAILVDVHSDPSLNKEAG